MPRFDDDSDFVDRTALPNRIREIAPRNGIPLSIPRLSPRRGGVRGGLSPPDLETVSAVQTALNAQPTVIVKDRFNRAPGGLRQPSGSTANRIQARVLQDRRRLIISQWLRSADRRRYHPSGSNAWPATIFGGQAQLATSARHRSVASALKFSSSALPCVDRQVRREVMFAKRKAGRAYRKPHRFTALSHVQC